MRSNVLILGAGPTGLGAAWRLQETGHCDWALIEAGSEAGGLASSFLDPKGFTWDVGGHIQFSHYDYFDRAMDEFLGPDGWLSHQRESWIWMRSRFIPYPLQNNAHRLPKEDLLKALLGLVEINKRPPAKPANFREWILATFGEGLADVFLFPYNFKVWAYPPETMNAGWVGERVAVTDLGRVLANLVNDRDDLSWGPNATFRFPRRGGTGAIWRACASKLPSARLRFGATVTAIDLEQRKVTTSDGIVHGYDNLVSTLPLSELIALSGQNQFRDLASRGLISSASNIFGVGLRGSPPPALKTKCWMYFPEDNCPFYRVTVFSNYSPHNVPEASPHWSLMAEVAESSAKPVNQETVFDEVVSGMLATGLIASAADIVSRWSYRTRHGYPTPSLGRDLALAELLPYFESKGVYSRGRFGAWKYEVSNQDHSFMQGVEAVEHLVRRRPEITVNDPGHANSRKHPWPFEQWS